MNFYQAVCLSVFLHIFLSDAVCLSCELNGTINTPLVKIFISIARQHPVYKPPLGAIFFFFGGGDRGLRKTRNGVEQEKKKKREKKKLFT